MLGLETTDILQLVAAIGGVAFFAAFVQATPERWTIAFILCLVPFQFVESRYGTGNMGIVYVAAIIFLIRGKINRLPVLLPVALVFMIYAISLTQAPRNTWSHHILYLIGLVPTYLMFYMAYNFVRRNPDPEFLLRLAMVVNFLVVIFCFLQLTLGPSLPGLFSISEFSETQRRLEGPFNGTHTSTEFTVIQVVLTLIAIMRCRQSLLRTVLWGLLAANIAILFMAGDRGGFVALVAGLLLYAFLFRKELGGKRIFLGLVGSAVIFAGAGLAVMQFTKYNVLFERLASTSVQAGVPDTRKNVWRIATERIGESPVIGHGPKLRIVTHYNFVEGIPYMPYPHNLVLHLLFTLGAVGLLAYAILFATLTFKMLGAARKQEAGTAGADAAKIGLIIMAVFMLSEIRVEFLRANVTDFQQYLFFVFGAILGFCDNGRRKKRRVRELSPLAASA